MADEIKYKGAEEFSTDITLYSGKVVHIDLMQITEKEWRKIFDKDTKDDEEIAVICKVTNLKPGEYTSLKLPEIKQLTEALLKLGLQPAANPT